MRDEGGVGLLCSGRGRPGTFVACGTLPTTVASPHGPHSSAADRAAHCSQSQPSIRTHLRLAFSAAIFEDTLRSHDGVISTWSSREREGGLWLLEISGRNVHWFVERLCSSHPSQLSRRRTLQSNQVRSDLPLRMGCE